MPFTWMEGDLVPEAVPPPHGAVQELSVMMRGPRCGIASCGEHRSDLAPCDPCMAVADAESRLGMCNKPPQHSFELCPQHFRRCEAKVPKGRCEAKVPRSARPAGSGGSGGGQAAAAGEAGGGDKAGERDEEDEEGEEEEPCGLMCCVAAHWQDRDGRPNHACGREACYKHRHYL